MQTWRQSMDAAVSVGLNEVNLGVRTTVIDYSRSRSLNIRADQGSLQDVLEVNEAGICVISDADNELIFSIAFKDPATVTSVQLCCSENPDEDTSAPKHVSFYSNLDTIDFDEVAQIQPAQEITIAKHEINDPNFRVSMKGAKFQKSNSIQIFIQSNQDDTEFTAVSSVRLYGFVCPPYTQQHLRPAT